MSKSDFDEGLGCGCFLICIAIAFAILSKGGTVLLAFAGLLDRMVQ